MRHKLHASSEENKRLQRALVKEIGDGTSMEQVDGWSVIERRNNHMLIYRPLMMVGRGELSKLLC